MKRKGLKLIISALTITMTLGILAGCGNKQENKEESKKEAISGSITALGSSALQPLVEQGAKQFMQKKSRCYYKCSRWRKWSWNKSSSFRLC
ncbi:phosphate ABC transporter phosphate-binding protein [Clostridium botulinum B str. Osaka05]|uniref:Phosphate ABC transporter phosphate-binding protein n=1 Tax=Clostridium botulinum B str. Osaka05 TaxID=1407017 RepID=A0A0S6U775_CLOBO|nr:phosphate ABC transporter phosphate-binding protein [Clostridium botulinum B str. Osaka05]